MIAEKDHAIGTLWEELGSSKVQLDEANTLLITAQEEVDELASAVSRGEAKKDELEQLHVGSELQRCKVHGKNVPRPSGSLRWKVSLRGSTFCKMQSRPMLKPCRWGAQD
jgi:hypothetical protein